MHTKNPKQVRESTAVSGCTKISCVWKVGGPKDTKIECVQNILDFQYLVFVCRNPGVLLLSPRRSISLRRHSRQFLYLSQLTSPAVCSVLCCRPCNQRSVLRCFHMYAILRQTTGNRACTYGECPGRDCWRSRDSCRGVGSALCAWWEHCWHFSFWIWWAMRRWYGFNLERWMIVCQENMLFAGENRI